MKEFCFIACILMASGCSTVSERNCVADWPEMAVTYHVVPHKQMRDVCAKYTCPLCNVEGCTEWNFDKKRVDVWTSSEFPSDGHVAHEAVHARGCDHIGGTSMAKSLGKWRNKNDPTSH